MGYDIVTQEQDPAQTSDGTHNYYRLNIWGMSEVRGALADLGLIALEYEMPVQADPEDFGLTFDRFHELDELEWEATQDEEARKRFESDPDLEKYEQFKEEAESYVDESTTDIVPIHKLCTNDGWLLTEEECAGTVELFDDLTLNRMSEFESMVPDEELRELVAEFIEYLRYVSKHGGARVW